MPFLSFNFPLRVRGGVQAARRQAAEFYFSLLLPLREPASRS
jgi:hypothetical protein